MKELRSDVFRDVGGVVDNGAVFTDGIIDICKHHSSYTEQYGIGPYRSR